MVVADGVASDDGGKANRRREDRRDADIVRPFPGA